MALYSGKTIYTVGLGLGAEVDLGVLSSLATSFRGAFYLTEDKWLSLPKFFIEILGDTLDEFVTLDPEYELVGHEPAEIDIDLGEHDLRVTFALFWADPGVTLELTVLTPNGFTVAAATAPLDPRVRTGASASHAFVQCELPLSAALGGSGEGRWRLLIKGNLAPGQHTRFGLTALVASNLGICCSTNRSRDATGEPIEFLVSMIEYGKAVEPTSLSLTIDRPVYSLGSLLGESWGTAPATLATDRFNQDRDLQREWVVKHDDRFNERGREHIELERVEVDGAVAFRGTLQMPTVEGSYNFRIVAELRRGPLILRRECGHSFAVLAYPSRSETEIDAQVDASAGSRRACLVVVRPRDEYFNLLGPGLAKQLFVRARGARSGKVRDLGNGDYAIPVSAKLDQNLEDAILALTIRGQRLEWRLGEILEHRQDIADKRRRPARPRPAGWEVG